MLKFPCLVLDHDDTVVQTERTIGFPYFREFVERIRPGQTLTFAEYVRDCNNLVFADMCRDRWRFTEAELKEEYLGWKAYSRIHVPEVCYGMEHLLRRYKEAGGIICVASLSTREIIERDYLHHIGFLPDAIYDYDLPAQQRKPEPYALEDIMSRFGLTADQLLVVDDMKLGWQMAQKVHAPTAFAGWSKAEFPELTAEMRRICDFSFDSPYEFQKFLFD